MYHHIDKDHIKLIKTKEAVVLDDFSIANGVNYKHNPHIAVH